MTRITSGITTSTTRGTKLQATFPIFFQKSMMMPFPILPAEKLTEQNRNLFRLYAVFNATSGRTAYRRVLSIAYAKLFQLKPMFPFGYTVVDFFQLLLTGSHIVLWGDFFSTEHTNGKIHSISSFSSLVRS